MALPPYNEVYNKNITLQTKVNNLEMELQHYKNYCIKQESVFSREFGDSNEKLRTMRNELNTKNQAYGSLQNDAVGYQNVARKLLEERNTYNTRIADLEASSQQQIQYYQYEIARLRDNFEQENREQVTKLNADLEIAKRKVSELHAKNQECANLQNDLLTYQEFSKKLAGERDVYKTEIAGLIKRHQQEKVNCEKKIADFQNIMDKSEKEKKEQAIKLNEDLETAKRKGQAWKAKWNDVDRERFRIAARRDGLENQIVTLKNTIEQLQTQESEDINQLSLQLDIEKTNLLDLQSKIGVCKLDCQRLIGLIEGKINLLRPAIAANDQNASVLEKFEKFLELLVEKLEEQLVKIQNGADNDNEDVVGKNEKLLDQIQNLQSENERLRSGEQNCLICCKPLVFPKCTNAACGILYHGECILNCFNVRNKSMCPYCITDSVELAFDWTPDPARPSSA